MGDIDNDLEGPLRRIPLPLPIEAYDWVAAEGLLCLFYVPPGGSDEPGGVVAELHAEEGEDEIVVRLVERALTGTYPDGGSAAVSTIWEAHCVAIELSRELGERTVIDGSSRQVVRPVDHEADIGTDDWMFLHAARRGCPIWER